MEVIQSSIKGSLRLTILGRTCQERFDCSREISKFFFEAAIMTTSIRSKLEEGNEGNLNKLLKALDMLSVLEKRHQDLLKEYEALAEKYLYTKKCSIDAVWRYIPMKSR